MIYLPFRSVKLTFVLVGVFGLGITDIHAQLPDYVPVDGLVGWYPFDGNAEDKSGHGNHGEIVGAQVAFDRFDLPASAFEFEHARIEISNNADTDQFRSISFWFRSESSSENQVAFKQNVFDGHLNERISCAINWGGDVHFAGKQTCNSNWQYNNASLALNDGVWHHYAGALSATEKKLYVDGVLVNSSPFQSESMCSGGDLIIGQEWDGVPYDFIGTLDDFGFWNRTLSEDEVLQLYNAPSPNTGCTDADACNYSVIANWDDGSCNYPLIPGDCDAGALACADGTYWNTLIQQCVPTSCPACPGDGDGDQVIGVSDLLLLLGSFGSACPETGCTDSQATNFNPNVIINDGSCVYPPCLDAQEPGDACDDGDYNTFNDAWNEDGCLCEGSEYIAENGSGPCEGVGTITYHGYEYQLVEIGTQCWFRENLRATNYSNGDSIQGDLTNDDWSTTMEGAQAIYDNNGTSLVGYGRLYNWYAASDPRGACPSGWRVPSDENLTTLTDYLGGTAIAGDALKVNVFGDLGDENSNSSGFGMRAGGNRSLVGYFSELGSRGYIWSTTGLLDQANARTRSFLSTSDEVGNGYSYRRTGFSVRCLKISTGSCFDPDGDDVCPEDEISGCTDETACNYDATATQDDGSCIPSQEDGSSCDDGNDNTFNDTWDVETCTCQGTSSVAEDGSGPCQGSLTVSYHGYDYQLVEISEQCWFKENLRSEHYANGDAIPTGLSNNSWFTTTSGAMAVYNNDSGYLESYGRLYNWYAVDDSRGLCPSGWHVPTDGEWMVLELMLGVTASAANSAGWRGTDQGVQMKSSPSESPSWNGTNSSGFSALPGGLRSDLGVFGSVVSDGYWWSASPGGYGAWNRYLNSSNDGVNRYSNFSQFGFSVRCVRD